MATISGSHGSDYIKGTSKNDVIKGGAGNDIIKGKNGNDTINGGTGDDKLYGGHGNDVFNGGLGSDTLYGENGNDTFNSILDDTIYGGKGKDIFNIIEEDEHPKPLDEETGIYYENHYTLYGEGGNDTFNIPLHNPLDFIIDDFYINGGSGNDHVNFSLSDGAGWWNKIPLPDKIYFEGGSGFDIYEVGGLKGLLPHYHFDDEFVSSISYDELENNFSFEKFDEFLTEIKDYKTYDHLFNYTKNFEQFNIGCGQFISHIVLKDKVINNDLDFVFNISSGYENAKPLYIDASDESGASLIFNVDNITDWNNGEISFQGIKIIGGAGDDQFSSAGEGDDIFQGNGGNDYFFGDDGHNTAVFNGKKEQYKITEIGYNKFTVRDKVKDRDGTDIIENVNTLRFSDGDYDLVLKGLKIEGDGSAEVINGGKYSDFLDGGGGNDKLKGKNGNDTILGGDGNDRLYGDRGNDQLNGGAGIDTVFFSGKSNVVNLSKTTKQNTKDGIDILKGIENVNSGSGNDKVYGSKGSNILSGGKGNDLLVGGKGNDKLIGGKGKDIFKLSKGKGYDLIQDFKNKQDKLFIGSYKNLKLKNKGKDVFIYSGKDLLAKVKQAKGDLSKKGKYLV